MSTSSALSRAALLTGAPGARGGVRRLPAGAAAGFRGVGGFAFTLSTTMAPTKPMVVTMLACAKATGPWGDYHSDEKEVDKSYAELSEEIEPFRTFGDEDDEFDKYYAALCKHTEGAMTGRFIILPLELSEEESALQNKLKEIAERCMDLQADAMRRLRPEQRRPLYLVFRTTHLALTSVKVRAMEGHANLGVSSLLIVHKLDVVRKMVSSACSAPLPLHKDKQEFSLLPPIGGLLVGVDSNNPEVALAFIEYTYNTVKSDIDEMITAASATTTAS